MKPENAPDVSDRLICRAVRRNALTDEPNALAVNRNNINQTSVSDNMSVENNENELDSLDEANNKNSGRGPIRGDSISIPI